MNSCIKHKLHVYNIWWRTILVSNNNSKEKEEILNTDGNIKDSVLEKIVDKAINQNPIIYERLGKI